MPGPADDPLLDFLDRHAADLRRIAAATSREFSADDVRNEAWLLAFDLGERRGRALDPGDPDDARLLLGHLYNRCVRFGERVVRHATRLDHAPPGADDDAMHPLLARLAADDGAHPEVLLDAFQSATPEPRIPAPQASPAAAWVWLLQRFNRRMVDVADYLRISLSWSYQRCRDAVALARTQNPLPATPVPTRDEPARPWRAFKLPRRRLRAVDPRQLRLDFWCRPAQPDAGQLWLL